jgi:hypothetical protein
MFESRSFPALPRPALFPSAVIAGSLRLSAIYILEISRFKINLYFHWIVRGSSAWEFAGVVKTLMVPCASKIQVHGATATTRSPVGEPVRIDSNIATCLCEIDNLLSIIYKCVKL